MCENGNYCLCDLISLNKSVMVIGQRVMHIQQLVIYRSAVHDGMLPYSTVHQLDWE